MNAKPDSIWHRPCPVCCRDDPVLLYRNLLAAVHGLDMSYEICRCGHCGFHYAARLPTPETYVRYYQSLSKYDFTKSEGEVPELDRRRAQAALRICLPYVPYDVGVADIGCGVGTLLNTFCTSGYSKLLGLDPAPDAAWRALRMYGLKYVMAGFANQAIHLLPLHEIGLVCLTGVLEHMPNLRIDMAALLTALPARVYVLIEVPALERFCHPSAEPFGEFSLEHIQYFSYSSLVNFMTSLGFSPLFSEILHFEGATDSLFALFARSKNSASPEIKPKDMFDVVSTDLFDGYLTQSCKSWNNSLKLIANQVPEKFIIYGAGSHTARLLPALDDMGLLNRVVDIFDGNPNLRGKTIAKYIIKSPAHLVQYKNFPVLISSYKAQTTIAKFLNKLHPLVLMY